MKKKVFTVKEVASLISQAKIETWEKAASMVQPVVSMNMFRKRTNQEMWGERTARRFKMEIAKLRFEERSL